jgi:hypothetical protein
MMVGTVHDIVYKGTTTLDNWFIVATAAPFAPVKKD